MGQSNKCKLKMKIVVCGGGIIGCSTALHLARRRGVRQVVLLEQNRLTEGTTWHAAGLIGTQKMNKPIAEMATKSRAFYASLKDECSQESLVGWHETGSLSIARTDETWKMLKHTFLIDQYLGNGAELVSPEKVGDLHPFLKLDGIHGGLWTRAKDGIVNPADITMYIARLAREAGVEIKENCELEAFQTHKDRVVGIKTNDGAEIACDQVLLAAGGWTRQLARRLMKKDVVPTSVVPHQYVVFENVKGISYDLPVVRDFDNRYYLKPEAGSTFLLGIFETNPENHLPVVVKERNESGEIPTNARNELFQNDLDKLFPWIDHALETVPVLGEVGIKAWVHGPDTHSADHCPILGKLPGSANVYVATGFNSQGIQCGYGLGLAMSEWMLDGHPHSFQTDFTGLDIYRFSPQFAVQSSWVNQRAMEGYGKLYSVHYPRELLNTARPQRLLPLHDRHVKAGAVFGEVYGWERPLFYTKGDRKGLEYSFDHEECEWFQHEKKESEMCRNEAVMFDLSPFGKLSLKGPGTEQLVETICTCHIASRPVGSVIYTFLCNERGKIVADVTVAKVSAEEFYMVTLANQAHLVLDHINRYINQKIVTVSNETEAFAVLGVMGPKSRQLLENAFEGPFDDESFPLYTFQSGQALRNGVVCNKLLRVSFSGALGWELHVPWTSAEQVYDFLHKTAKDNGIPFQDAGLYALMNSLRIEKKFVHYGHEIGPHETPLDVGMSFACKLGADDPDFVGRDALLQQKKTNDKPNKQLLTVVLSEPRHDIAFWGMGSELLLRNGEIVGYITSGGFSHNINGSSPIGLAICKNDFKIKNDSDRYQVRMVTKNGSIQDVAVKLSKKSYL